MMGKFTGKPKQFDGKNPWVSGFDFPNKTNPLTYLLCTFFPGRWDPCHLGAGGIYAISAPVSPKKTRRPLMLATKSTAGATTDLLDLGPLGPWQLENHPIPKTR